MTSQRSVVGPGGSAAGAPPIPRRSTRIASPEQTAGVGGRLTMTAQEVALHVTLVHVRVLSDQVDAFIEASRANHAGSVREPGNLRFDVLRDPGDPTRFVIYEVFVDEAAAAAHKTTAHYLAWRERVAPMMAEPRRGESWQAVMLDVADPTD